MISSKQKANAIDREMIADWKWAFSLGFLITCFVVTYYTWPAVKFFTLDADKLIMIFCQTCILSIANIITNSIFARLKQNLDLTDNDTLTRCLEFIFANERQELANAVVAVHRGHTIQIALIGSIFAIAIFS